MWKRTGGFGVPLGKLNLFLTAGYQDISHFNHFGEKKSHILIVFHMIYSCNALKEEE